MNRTILHVDMDAFFAAVEERCNPALRGKPLAVAGPGKRTVITTSSYAARSFGVRTGMSVGQGKRLCPDLIVVRCDHRKYSHASRAVLTVLESFTPAFEPYSVDEAFIDATLLQRRFDNISNLAMKIKGAIRRETGLTCSIGAAPNKLLAKLASGKNKPDGLTILNPEQIPSLLEKTPVGELCGIGPETTRQLKSMGIETCGRLGRFPLDILSRRFGVYGGILSRMGRGEDSSPIHCAKEGEADVKSVGHSVTLTTDVEDSETVTNVLHTLSEMVGRRARRHECAGYRLTLTVRYSDFLTFSRQKTFPAPLRTTEQIYEASLMINREITLTSPVRLLGLSLGNLVFGFQPNPLLPEDRRKEALQEALDRINDRYGEFSLGYAGQIHNFRGNRIISPSWRPKGIRNST